ncbi:phosphotransferase [Demequina capsici]|uniref:Phosphotransferase n=1 Tax=Demequina capsici TaxID=3075620 RepID=A0AA96JC06_9MICO|nr:phosphotransferase [Demequina sp. PMTSA13]WNM28633.1 phosphotransferase [Demequina sp. PMTSA13]
MTPDRRALLTGDGAGALLRQALGAAGRSLETWSVDAVHDRPGAELSVSYDVVIDGAHRYLVASTIALADGDHPGVMTVSAGPDQVKVWEHPADPLLPGLAEACDPVALGGAITAALGTPIEVRGMSVLVLRPLRRAVLRIECCAAGDPAATQDVRYVKVVEPAHAEDVAARYRLSSFAPEARVLGDGLVLLESATGRPLTEHLYDPQGRQSIPPIVPPQAVLDVLNDLSPAALALSRRPSWTDRLPQYAAQARERGLPWAGEIEDLVGDRLRRGDPGPVVPVHGDLHAANLFLAPRDGTLAASSLIDLDTAGPGHLVDDAACLLAHMLTLPTFSPYGYRHVPDVHFALAKGMLDQVDAHQLAGRTAAVLVSLAAGAENRSHAEAWMEQAARAAAS